MNFYQKKIYNGRTLLQLKNHYEVEKAIATRLKRALRDERKIIYQLMYDELFEKVPDHPRLKSRDDPFLTKHLNKNKLNLIRRFLNKSTVYAEFGAGDCKFALYICPRVKHVYGIDISNQAGKFYYFPNNFKFIKYDGYNLDLKDNSIDLAFSDQLIEHLHPEDISSHFQLVKRILKPSGYYIFRTPHRFSGPHDISRYFSEQAEGFHLKEWTYRDLSIILKDVDYLSWHGYWRLWRLYLKMPFIFFNLFESILTLLPKKSKKQVARYLLPEIVIAAVK